jgi:hypothetical protein
MGAETAAAQRSPGQSVIAQPIRSFVANDRTAGGPVGPESTGRGRRWHPAAVTAAPDDRIGLAEQIAADLLPEAGDSGTVDGGEGL